MNINLAIFRKRNINTNAKKIFEALGFAFMTAICFFLVVFAKQNACYNNTHLTNIEESVSFTCKGPNQYNPLATLIFNTEGGTIRTLIDYPTQLKRI